MGGLISGNLKRHLKAAHGYQQWQLSPEFGGRLLSMIDPECLVCEHHRLALVAEMEGAY
jgi:hypothetical protein